MGPAPDLYLIASEVVLGFPIRSQHAASAVARARSMPVLGAAKPSSADTNVLCFPTDLRVM
jgi:hypothetical protein